MSNTEILTNIAPAIIAIRASKTHGAQKFTAQQMCWAVQHLAETHPTAIHYINHPDVIVGLSEGKFGKLGLLRKLQELEEIDNH